MYLNEQKPSRYWANELYLWNRVDKRSHPISKPTALSLLQMGMLTHWPLGDLNVILGMQSSILLCWFGTFNSSHGNVLRWMPHDLTDDESTLIQVTAWCRQATSHYLNQCWPRSPMPYGVTRPNELNLVKCGHLYTFYLMKDILFQGCSRTTTTFMDRHL